MALRRWAGQPRLGETSLTHRRATKWTLPRTTIPALVLLLLLLPGSQSVAALHGSARNIPPGHPLATAQDSLPPGQWEKARPGDVTPLGLTDEQKQEIARLRSIGYLSGTQSVPARVGVTVYDSEKAHDGYNFYTSGHLQGAILADMEGNIVHEWRCDFAEVWPDYVRREHGRGDKPGEWFPWTSSASWRRAYLYENGDVLGVYEGVGVVKLDRDSRVLWSYLGGCHHDLDVLDDGTVYVLTRDAHILPRYHKHWPVLEDYVSVLDAGGREMQRVSVLEAFERSGYTSFLEGMKRRGDFLHTNTVEVLDGRLADRNPAFRKGNVLISVRKLDVIAVIDMERAEVVWALGGLWDAQHQPTVLENGRMLIFDNRGERTPKDEEASKVFEFDPFTQEIHWSYGGGRIDFYSRTCGSAERLPNGNTLITESDFGRAFEVTEGGEIVWEFMNPARAGNRDEFIATLFEVVRVPRGYVAGWLRAK